MPYPPTTLQDWCDHHGYALDLTVSPTRVLLLPEPRPTVVTPMSLLFNLDDYRPDRIEESPHGPVVFMVPREPRPTDDDATDEWELTEHASATLSSLGLEIADMSEMGIAIGGKLAAINALIRLIGGCSYSAPSPECGADTVFEINRDGERVGQVDFYEDPSEFVLSTQAELLNRTLSSDIHDDETDDDSGWESVNPC